MHLNRLGNHSTLRTNLYPPINDEDAENYNVRIGDHSDVGSFTFLFQDNVGGLQVRCVIKLLL